MKKYILKSKDGDVINITMQNDKKDAIEFFSKIKLITEKQLLDIYKVEQYENRDND